MPACKKVQAGRVGDHILNVYWYSESRVGVIKIVIVINCNSITFSKVIACNCNCDFSLITVIECN